MRQRIWIAALVSVMAAVGAQAAFARGEAPSATKFQEVLEKRSTDPSSTSSVTWVDVPGADLTAKVAAGQQVLLIARFTGESTCTGPAEVSRWCSVRILAGAAEMLPAVGIDYAFDSTDNGQESTNSFEQHALERSLTVIAACSEPTLVPVRVQYQVSGAGTTFNLDDWHLSVERLYSNNIPC